MNLNDLMNFCKKHTTIILLTFTLVGTFFRLYNLNWGAPFYFHPDERNIASAVSQLAFPEQMNPHFFAYGSLPLYVIFFTGLASTFFSSCSQAFTHCHISFEQAIILSRLYSAFFSIALIPLLFFIGKRIYGEKAGLLASGLATFSVGFIQFAHFGTTEMWLAFFSTLLFYVILSRPSTLRVIHIIVAGIICGILVATKISSLVLLILPLPALYFSYKKSIHGFSLKSLIKTGNAYLCLLVIAALFFFVTNPFIFLGTTSFLGSLQYESSVALGTLPVFYTQEFFNTIPGIYQFIFVYPFLLNPLCTLLLIPAIVIVGYRIFTRKERESLYLLLFFFILFASQANLFVKWTRYMLPTLPFIYLLLSGAAVTFFEKRKGVTGSQTFATTATLLFFSVAVVFACSFLLTTYAAPDTRVAAAEFAKKNLPPTAVYLSEVYDLGITPFNPLFSQIVLFNFYDLDTPSLEASPAALMELQKKANYIVLPSQRIVKIRSLKPDKFPRGYLFYKTLTNSSLYTKIYETPCNLFCNITYLGNPIYSYEESASVFDRPTVMIYKKNE